MTGNDQMLIHFNSNKLEETKADVVREDDENSIDDLDLEVLQERNNAPMMVRKSNQPEKQQL